jgi:hypothetical protein
MKISEDSSNSKDIVFNVKKLLDYGTDLTLQQMGKKCYMANGWQVLWI